MEKRSTCACQGLHVHELPPGYNFEPTDGELVQRLLNKRLQSPVDDPNTHILDLHIYKNLDHPDQLPERYPIDSGERRWFFYTPRERKHTNGSRPSRTTEDGYWKTSKEVPIKIQDVIVGYKNNLVFYKYNNKNVPHQLGGSTKTDWLMNEYRCEKTPTIKRTAEGDMKKLDDWVVCKIYYKEAAKLKREHLEPQQEPLRMDHPLQISFTHPLTNDGPIAGDNQYLMQNDRDNLLYSSNIPMGFEPQDQQDHFQMEYQTPANNEPIYWDNQYRRQNDSLLYSSNIPMGFEQQHQHQQIHLQMARRPLVNNKPRCGDNQYMMQNDWVNSLHPSNIPMGFEPQHQQDIMQNNWDNSLRSSNTPMEFLSQNQQEVQQHQQEPQQYQQETYQHQHISETSSQWQQEKRA